jgi:hypothetical protein
MKLNPADSTEMVLDLEGSTDMRLNPAGRTEWSKALTELTKMRIVLQKNTEIMLNLADITKISLDLSDNTAMTIKLAGKTEKSLFQADTTERERVQVDNTASIQIERGGKLPVFMKKDGYWAKEKINQKIKVENRITNQMPREEVNKGQLVVMQQDGKEQRSTCAHIAWRKGGQMNLMMIIMRTR